MTRLQRDLLRVSIGNCTSAAHGQHNLIRPRPRIFTCGRIIIFLAALRALVYFFQGV